MSSNSRMTRSKGPAEELSLPPTRMRKDVSTANEGEENAQGQVQTNVPSQQRIVDMPSPFARPGSRAGTCTTPASDGEMLPKASNPFSRPDSCAGFAPSEPTSPQSSVSSTNDNQLQEDMNTSVSSDLVDTDTDAEVANINTRQNNAVDVNNAINTSYNQDFFVADTMGRRLSQVADKSNYTLYTDASKYGWAGVLTQLHTTIKHGKTITADHPVAYVSGLFRGSQINWAALTKEAYAIYMSVKKLSFYLTDAEVLLKSDHLPLKKFLQKNTLNNKVNNWAMELEAFNIKFQHVSGRTNILADTLSRLVDIDPDARLDPENAGWEFGYYVFETLPKLSSEEIASVCEVLSGTNIILPDADLQEPFTQILTSPLTNDQLQALQAQDEKCKSLTAMLKRGKLDPLVYSMNDGVLHQCVIEGGQTFQAIYVPRTPPGLIESILKAAHDDSGHNGFPRT